MRNKTQLYLRYSNCIVIERILERMRGSYVCASVSCLQSARSLGHYDLYSSLERRTVVSKKFQCLVPVLDKKIYIYGRVKILVWWVGMVDSSSISKPKSCIMMKILREE